MKQSTRQVVLVVSAVLMVALAVVTIFAMVMAPLCTGIMQKANSYKVVSLCVFLGAYYLLAWRRRSIIAAMVLPASQIVSGMLFIGHLNTLPIECPD